MDNTFYFNIGDMLEAWSGGLFVATPHRVVNSGDERFSIPYFAATDFNATVSPVESPRYSHRQNHYEPIIAGEHLVSQLLRDFPYLRRRYESGLIQLSKAALPCHSPRYKVRQYFIQPEWNLVTTTTSVFLRRCLALI
jgi:hypothetical protein